MGSPGDEVDYSKRSTEELKEMKATGGKLVESFVKGGGAPGITEAQKKEMADAMTTSIDAELQKRGE
ncbi:MAG: hypothetical protein IID41_04855 [Planctomycetes bacterium]|nr:hypothetical protein [Planctomycetota bacterium]